MCVDWLLLWSLVSIGWHFYMAATTCASTSILFNCLHFLTYRCVVNSVVFVFMCVCTVQGDAICFVRYLNGVSPPMSF